MATLQEQLAQISTDAEALHQIVHGDPATQVPTDGGDVPSVQKLFADISAREAANVAQAQADVQTAINAVGAAITVAEAAQTAAEGAQEAVSTLSDALDIPTPTGADAGRGMVAGPTGGWVLGGTAAAANIGTEPNNVSLNSDLGTAAFKTATTAAVPGNVPLFDANGKLAGTSAEKKTTTYFGHGHQLWPAAIARGNLFDDEYIANSSKYTITNGPANAITWENGALVVNQTKAEGDSYVTFSVPGLTGKTCVMVIGIEDYRNNAVTNYIQVACGTFATLVNSVMGIVLSQRPFMQFVLHKPSSDSVKILFGEYYEIHCRITSIRVYDFDRATWPEDFSAASTGAIDDKLFYGVTSAITNTAKEALDCIIGYTKYPDGTWVIGHPDYDASALSSVDVEIVSGGTSSVVNHADSGVGLTSNVYKARVDVSDDTNIAVTPAPSVRYGYGGYGGNHVAGTSSFGTHVTLMGKIQNYYALISEYYSQDTGHWPTLSEKAVLIDTKIVFGKLHNQVSGAFYAFTGIAPECPGFGVGQVPVGRDSRGLNMYGAGRPGGNSFDTSIGSSRILTNPGAIKITEVA